MIYEDDRFNIPEKYKKMSIEELEKEKEQMLKEYEKEKAQYDFSNGKRNPYIKKKNDKYLSMFHW